MTVKANATRVARRKLRIAAAQMKFRPALEENLASIARLARSAARRHADAVLFPECAVTGYAYDFATLQPPRILEALREIGQLAARLRIYLLVGTPVFRRHALYNCLVAFDRHAGI